MLPPIIAPMIVPIDEGSLIRKPDELYDEPLVLPPFELIITQTSQQIISSISSQIDHVKDKWKKIALSSDSPVKLPKKSEGWSKEQMQQDLEESI